MNIKQTGLTFFTLIAGATLAWGNGFHSNVSDAASLGQATGGITRNESATVAQDLPAAMPFLKQGIHALAGFIHVTPRFSFDGPEGTGDTETPPVDGAHINAFYNMGSFAFGVSQNFPFNSVIDWGDDFVGRDVVKKVDLSIGTTSPVAAYRLGSFAFGGGLDFYEGNVNLKRTSLILNGSNEVGTELGGTGTGNGYNLSAYYERKQFSVGFMHHSNVTLRADDAHARFDTSDSSTQVLTSRFPDSKVKVDLLLPSVTRLGLAFKEKLEDPDYMLELTATRTGWSNYKELRFRFDKEIAGNKVSVSKKDWFDTTAFALSGNYVFSRSGDTTMKLRVGYFSEPTPIPKKTLDGITPDTGRSGMAAGLGMVFGKIITDFSFLTETFPKGSSSLEELKGEYNGHAEVFSGSVGYHW